MSEFSLPVPSEKPTSATTPGTIPGEDVCAGCPLLCDDIDWSQPLTSVCQKGSEWYQAAVASASDAFNYIAGNVVTLPEAISAAAKILRDSRAVEIDLVGPVGIETVQAAIGLAKATGGVLRTSPATANPTAGAQAFSATGLVTGSLGEIRQRADLVILLHVDLANELPRFTERYLKPAGKFVDGQSRTRKVISLGNCANDADQHVSISLESTLAAVASLEALAADRPINDAVINRQTGHAPEVWRQLAEACQQANYVGVVVGEQVLESRFASAVLQKLSDWILALQSHTRAVALPVRQCGELTAENVLMAMEGWTQPLSFRDETAAQVGFANPQADCRVVIGSVMDGGFTIEKWEDKSQFSQSSQLIALLDQPAQLQTVADVAISVATPGADAEASLYRMDDVSLHLRKTIQSERPNPVEILSALLTATAEGTVGAK